VKSRNRRQSDVVQEPLFTFHRFISEGIEGEYSWSKIQGNIGHFTDILGPLIHCRSILGRDNGQRDEGICNCHLETARPCEYPCSHGNGNLLYQRQRARKKREQRPKECANKGEEKSEIRKSVRNNGENDCNKKRCMGWGRKSVVAHLEMRGMRVLSRLTLSYGHFLKPYSPQLGPEVVSCLIQ
jgi:hypothetical protein